MAALNLTQKIIQEHLTAGDLKAGNEVSLRVDQGLLQDTTGTMGFLQLEELGIDRIKIPFAIVYVDHNILAIDFKNPDDHMFLRSFAQKHGIHFSRPGTGICPYLHMERCAVPGQIRRGAASPPALGGPDAAALGHGTPIAGRGDRAGVGAEPDERSAPCVPLAHELADVEFAPPAHSRRPPLADPRVLCPDAPLRPRSIGPGVPGAGPRPRPGARAPPDPVSSL